MRERTWYRRSSIRPVRSERAESDRGNFTALRRRFGLFAAGGTSRLHLQVWSCTDLSRYGRLGPQCVPGAREALSWKTVSNSGSPFARHRTRGGILSRGPGGWRRGSSAEPARGPGRVAVAYSGDARPYVIDIVRVEPQGYASFRWASAFGGTEPAQGNATLVEFYLRPVGDELGVTVVESGFASLDLPEALREDEWKGTKGGWQYELAALRTRAERCPSGASPAKAAE